MKRIFYYFRTSEILGVFLVIVLPLLAYFIKSNLYCGDLGEYCMILGSLMTLLGGLYGIFWFWPNYLQQKRLENLIVTTKEALGGHFRDRRKNKTSFFRIS